MSATDCKRRVSSGGQGFNPPFIILVNGASAMFAASNEKNQFKLLKCFCVRKYQGLPDFSGYDISK
jgi:hypothetical protein